MSDDDTTELTVLERADQWLDQPHGLEGKATWDLINDLAREVAELRAELDKVHDMYRRERGYGQFIDEVLDEVLEEVRNR